MKPENQVGIVYEDLTKREKIKFIKSIHKKLKNHIDLDVHEINFVMSSRDMYLIRKHMRINDWMDEFRNVDYGTIVNNWVAYDFCWQKVFRMLYLDSSTWEAITQIVNRYVSIQDDKYTKFNILIGREYSGYEVKFDNLPKNIRRQIFLKSQDIFYNNKKEHMKQEQKFYNNLKTNTKTKELFSNDDENDSDLVM